MSNTWFYPAQTQAMGVLNEKYDRKSCQSQTITKDRVIEKYICSRFIVSLGDVAEFVTVEYINCEDQVRVMVAKVTYTDDFYI